MKYTTRNETDEEMLQRFFSKVKEVNGCWEWQAAVQKYAVFSRKTSRISGHRYSYETFKGDIPESFTIDHLCKNKVCVNPDHLECVTSAENTKRFNADRTHCKRGHEFTPENTWLEKHGRRHCRSCKDVRRYGVVTQRGYR